LRTAVIYPSYFHPVFTYLKYLSGIVFLSEGVRLWLERGGMLLAPPIVTDLFNVYQRNNRWFAPFYPTTNVSKSVVATNPLPRGKHSMSFTQSDKQQQADEATTQLKA